MNARIVAILISLFLAACGGGGGYGGGGGSPAPSAAQGLWIGTTGDNRALAGIVLDNGTYYFLYSPVGNAALIAGVAQGTSSASNATFSSTNTRDFSFEDGVVTSGSITGSYMERQTISGSAVSLSGANTFSASFDSRYDSAPTIANVVGTFTGQSATLSSVDNVSVTVANDGSFVSLGAGGCSSSGIIAPRSAGNIFDLTLYAGPAPCAFAGQTLTGIAFYDGTDNSIRAVAINSSRTDLVLFTGSKL